MKRSKSITPPPTKRRKTSRAEDSPTLIPSCSSTPPPPLPPSSIRIFSWNINGITPFLQNQNTITSYFTHSTRHQPKEPNPNSIPPPSLRSFLYKHNWPAILFLQEVKISSQDTKTQTAVRRIVNSPLLCETGLKDKGPEYDVHFVLPTDRFNARGLRGKGNVYGVATIYRRDLGGTFNLKISTRTVDWDNEGRISVLHLSSQPQSPSSTPTSSKSKPKPTNLALINIYAINGTQNPYYNPSTGHPSGTRHTRKLAFHTLLRDECLHLESQGWNVIVAGDFNVALEKIDGYPNLRCWPEQHIINRRDFHSKLICNPNLIKSADTDDREKEDINGKETKWQGVDIDRQKYPTTRRCTYFPRNREWGSSCDRVDYVLVGRGLWEKGLVGATGMLDSSAGRGPSDHVPVWVDVKISVGDGDAEIEEQGNDPEV